MACELPLALWSPGIIVQKGVLDGAGESFSLVVENKRGLIPGVEDLVVRPELPLAIRFVASVGETPSFQFMPEQWPAECGDALESIVLNMPGSGFSFRYDGKAVGFSLLDGKFTLFYINLVDFPVVFWLDGEELKISFKGDDPSKYYKTVMY